MTTRQSNEWVTECEFDPERVTIHHLLPKVLAGLAFELNDGRRLLVPRESVYSPANEKPLPFVSHALCHHWWADILAKKGLSETQRSAELGLLHRMTRSEETLYWLMVEDMFETGRCSFYFDPLFGAWDLEKFVVRPARKLKRK